MVLIPCPECKKEISDKAGSCPTCGHPITAVTIEITGKKWKTWKIYSLSAIGFGIGFLSLWAFYGSEWLGILGLLLILGGIIGCFFSVILSWWHHG